MRRREEYPVLFLTDGGSHLYTPIGNWHRHSVAAARLCFGAGHDSQRIASHCQEAGPPVDFGYLEAKCIQDLLIEANPESRNFFGRLSGVAGECDGIVRAYEKELLHLGEASQIMVHYADYEIPSQKEIAKVQQQLIDMEKKEAEYRRVVKDMYISRIYLVHTGLGRISMSVVYVSVESVVWSP